MNQPLWILAALIILPLALFASCAIYGRRASSAKELVYMIFNGLVATYAAIVATYLLYNSYPAVAEGKGYDFDYIGAIVGIQSLIVTLLLGWNIYSVIDARSRVQRMEDKIQRMEDNNRIFEDKVDAIVKGVKKRIDSVESSADSDSYYIQGIVLSVMNINSHLKTFSAFVKGLNALLAIEDGHTKGNIREGIDTFIGSMEFVLENRAKDKDADTREIYQEDKLRQDMDDIMVSQNTFFSASQRARFSSLRVQILGILDKMKQVQNPVPAPAPAP